MLINFDDIYMDLVNQVIRKGTDCSSRGLSYRQLFGVGFRIDLQEVTPLLTLRKLPLQSIVDELLWDINGHSEISLLGKAKNFWNFLTNSDDNGVLRGSYGKAWRAYPSHDYLNYTARGEERYYSHDVDQLSNAIAQLRACPTSRQITVTTHMPMLSNYACPPCHTGFILSSDGVFLDMLVTSRSNDLAFGTPLDVARYSLMQMWFAKLANLKPRYHQHAIANLHIYDCNRDELIRLCQNIHGNPGSVTVECSQGDFSPQFIFDDYNSPAGNIKLSNAALK